MADPMKPSIVLFAAYLLIASKAYGEVSREGYCFRAWEEGVSSFEMRTYYDNTVKWSGGFVKYENSSALRTVVLASSDEELHDKGRPIQLVTTWLEINGDRVSGTYEMFSQGAMVYSMVYVEKRSGAKKTFLFDPSARSTPEAGCNWK